MSATAKTAPLCAEGNHRECGVEGERGPFRSPPERRDCHCPCHARQRDEADGG